MKGILKVTTQNQQLANIAQNARKKKTENKKIRFEVEENLEKIKVFKLTDEPKSADITEEEYMQIQNEIRKDPLKNYLGDMKLRESNLEKENLFKLKEKAKIAKEIFEKMTSQIKINKPLGIFFIKFY